MARSLSILSAAEVEPLARKAAAILKQVIHDRTGITVSAGAAGECRIRLEIQPGIGCEGYRIAGGSNGDVRITGNDARGLLYGVGGFLRGSRFAAGDFTPSAWRGSSVPEKPVRGIYFASHFHNFYDDAPVEENQRYVEDLALWGCNALSVWFDMHHFSGFDDPAARKCVERLRAILQTAGGVGISAAIGTLANEAYNASPPDLRADWTAGHDGYTQEPGGHYHVELCPSKPGATEMLLAWRREMLEAFTDLDIQYLWLWPYDQGGCTCSKCAPWGANGFLRIAEPVARLARELLPDAKIILSTWYFDRFTTGEFEGLARALERKPDWIDYVMVNAHDARARDFLRSGAVPAAVQALDFPEISMGGMAPWGGFGANPRSTALRSYWDEAGDLVAGGFPYSEGIFEDINKVLMLQWYWDPTRAAEEIIREYIAAEFSHEVVDDVARAVEIMDRNLDHQTVIVVDGVEHSIYRFSEVVHPGTPCAIGFRFGERRHTEDCLALMERAAARLPPRAKESWRWRVLWLRAALDAETERSGRVMTDQSDAYFEELIRLYHARESDVWAVLPPSRAAIQRLAQVKSTTEHF